MSFFLGGPCEDQAYLKTHDHPCGVDHKRFVEAYRLELEKTEILSKGKGQVDR
jgi:hypothetical protein